MVTVGEAVCADLPAMFDKARVARGRTQVVLSEPPAPQPPALPPSNRGCAPGGGEKQIPFAVCTHG